MENKGKLGLKVLFLTISLLFLLILNSYPATASSVQPADGQVICTERQMTVNKSDQRNPAISNDKIVWQDARAG